MALAGTLNFRPINNIQETEMTAMKQTIPACHVEHGNPTMFGNVEGSEMLRNLRCSEEDFQRMKESIEKLEVCYHQCHELSKTTVDLCS